MTLLITFFAALISTIMWYKKPDNHLKLGTLSLIYWGATLMWLIDGVASYMEMGAEYFTPAPLDMLNDSYLGLYAVALGLLIWIFVLLIKDPLHKFVRNNK